MILSFSGQAKLFIMTVAVGFFIGFVFDVFRISRKVYRHPNFLIQLEDLTYWLFVTFVMFYYLLNRNYGEIRYFSILGFLLGACLYFLTLSILVIKISMAVIGFVKAVLRTMLKIILFPVKLIIKAASIPLNLLKRALKKLLSPIKNILQKLLRYVKMRSGRVVRDFKIIAKKI